VGARPRLQVLVDRNDARPRPVLGQGKQQGLTGLEKCKNLASLKLSNNQVADWRRQGADQPAIARPRDNQVADLAPLKL